MIEEFKRIIHFSFSILYICQHLSVVPVMAFDDPKLVIRSLARLSGPWKSPYQKFGYTSAMFNVCTLHYLQKRELCQTLLSTDLFDLQFMPEKQHEYPDLSCKRIYADFSNIAKDAAYKSISVAAYKCPNAYKVDVTISGDFINQQKTFIPIRLYISGSVVPNTAVVYYQHIGSNQTPIKAHLVVFGVPVKMIWSVGPARREMMWQRSMEYLRPYHEYEFERLIHRWSPIIRSPVEAEKGVIHIAAMKLFPPMEKFINTFKVKNLCSMKRNEKLNLCIRAFQNKVYQTLIQNSGELVCQRRDVVLNFSTPIKSGLRISSIKCPAWRWSVAHSFNLSSILHKATLLASIQFYPFPELIPDAIITV